MQSLALHTLGRTVHSNIISTYPESVCHTASVQLLYTNVLHFIMIATLCLNLIARRKCKRDASMTLPFVNVYLNITVFELSSPFQMRNVILKRHIDAYYVIVDRIDPLKDEFCLALRPCRLATRNLLKGGLHYSHSLNLQAPERQGSNPS